jgi:hypothetical protein
MVRAGRQLRHSIAVESAFHLPRRFSRPRRHLAEGQSVATLAAERHRSACPYTDKHVGSRGRVGNQGGTLGNRLRAVLGEKK